jgi:hypothetical protein
MLVRCRATLSAEILQVSASLSSSYLCELKTLAHDNSERILKELDVAFLGTLKTLPECWECSSVVEHLPSL